jgi:hypothetical protein
LLVRTERARVSRWEQGLLGYPNCSPEFIATADPHGSVSMAGSYAKSTSGKVLSLLFYLAYTLSRVHQGGGQAAAELGLSVVPFSACDPGVRQSSRVLRR